MATTLFKLTQPDGLTRRITFPNQPAWNELASKIAPLYAIPLDNVSVSYIDADNDQVTLSTQQELEDFYKTSHQPGQVIKFTVQDLASARQQRAQAPRTSNVRNTFGIGAFDIEDDWQTLPIPPISELGGIFATSNPTAFVEVVDSDASTVANRQDADHDRESTVPSSVHSSPGSPFIIPLDKGKTKVAEDDDISSTGSVLAEDAPPKPPVHVYDLSSAEQDKQHPFQPSPAVDTVTLPTPPVAAQSTPKVDARTIKTTVLGAADAAKEPTKEPTPQEEVADPPLPSFEPDGAGRPVPSLSDDIANLINTFNDVVGAHPELSEGIRNIMRNTATGTYWHGHREAISRAAQDIARETGRATESLRREAEAEAGRRVAEALGGIFYAISQTLGATYGANPQDTSAPPANGTAPRPETATSAPPEASASAQGGRPARPGPNFGPWMHRGASFGRWGQRVPPPPPFGPPRVPWGWRGDQTQTDVPLFAPPHAPPMPGSWQSWAPSPAPPPPPPPPPAPNPPPHTHKPTPQELRAQVDAAKAAYKAEKERYRREREERRKERERKARTVAVETPAPVTVTDTRAPRGPPARPPTPPVIAVHGKGRIPTHEVVSVHRRHTLAHSLSRHHGHDQGDLKSRAVHRITRRLADMGFTENAYPDLLSKIKQQLPADGVLTKDAEDNIVTTLLEELLAMSPKPSVPSGSASRDFPGTWH
ncbi:hypothetical protein LshimejAT787_0301640 [Lyophyllum shimeji]|uniref:PB1 domain-containing protein n=1 Tax=Lyophyllum shimeji TaxID=47721 RepID=A0A9P3UM08_LYOSH|nr:hypothetical protein LshimejAT787_0301640 [Lyophyllum shimeji]